MENIEEKIKLLPANLQKEVIDFIDFLLAKHCQIHQGKKKLSFDWIGGLKEYRSQYTAVDLQKKASQWRD